jgi:hypothetical protein
MGPMDGVAFYTPPRMPRPYLLPLFNPARPRTGHAAAANAANADANATRR